MSRKQEQILALAVSLWIAGGGYSVASAEVSSGEVTVTSKADADAKVAAGTLSQQGGNQYYTLASDSATKLTITGGDYTAGGTVSFAARYKTSGAATNGTLTVQGGTFSDPDLKLYGGFGQTKAEDNTVEISGGTINVDICGGGSAYLDASGNQVTISGDANLAQTVTIYGGFSGEGDAINNTVTIARDNLKVKGIYGGFSENPVNTSGNVVILNATGIEATGDISAETIKIGSGVTLDPAKTVAKAGDFTGTLDISGAEGLKKSFSGTMTLLSSGTSNDFKGLNLNYYSGGTAVLNEANTAQVVYDASLSTQQSGVTLDYNTNHTVSINQDGASTYKKVTYSAASEATKLTFANVEWKDTGTLIDAATTWPGITFTAATALNAEKLKFTNPEAVSGEMTLLSNATGLTASAATYSHTQNYTCSPLAGVMLDAVINGTIQRGSDSLTYTGTNQATKLTFTNVAWQDTGALIDAKTTWPGITFTAATALNAENLTFTNPEAVSGEMTLLANAAGLTASAATLSHTQNYTASPLTGVMLNAVINGTVQRGSDSLTYTGTNQATKLTFTNVEWKDTGALIDHSKTLANVSFAGADVDTTNIAFTNIQSLAANKKMTLVSDFGTSVGTITGTEYTVGTVLKGKGKASLSGSDLIFTTETGVGDVTSQEQTHNAVMGMSAGVAALSAGNASIGEAVEGLGNAANQGADGVAVYAGMGGGSSRQETGSHVDSHTWNAILALGTKREQAKGSLEWGGFFEYGRSNYTLHSDAGRGDGNTHYSGGGVLAKWTNHHKTYIEASFRAGRMKDNAADIFQDALGNRYGYNVHAGYHGAHIGLGQVFDLGGGRSLDVYGKFFYNKRNGVSFNAGGQYDLDAVASKILRIGTRYSAGVGRNWNWYGGLAYEYELDGEATGKVTIGGVSAPIRAASTRGGSALAELGLHLEPTAASPWKADIGLRGSCGKHRGVGGAVSVAYMF